MTELPQAAGPAPAEWTTPAVPVAGPAGPPARRTPWRSVLIVLGVVIVLCCGGTVLGGLYLAQRVAKDVAPVRQAADTFFRGLVNGSDVYGQLCSAAKTAITQQQFDQLRETRPLREYTISGTNVSNVNGHESATVTVQLSFASGSETHVVPMASEGGAWRVCGRPY